MLFLAVAALALVAATTATAASAAPHSLKPSYKPPVTAKPACGTIGQLSGEGTPPTEVEVLKARKLSCAEAREVVASCVSHNRVDGWTASPVNVTATLKRDKQRIAYAVISGPPPRCARGLQRARTSGLFGPFQAPLQYPGNWPPPFRIKYDWTTPVTTFSASIAANYITDVSLSGYALNRTGDMRSFWFEYGKTRDLGTDTEKQNPRTTGGDEPVTMEAKLLHLKAATRYYWRSVGRVDEPGGGVKTVYGALGSFVTKPYPTIKNPSRPCDSVPDTGQVFQITESLAIKCSSMQHFSEDACAPFCVRKYSGRLDCDKAYPRNLNAGDWSVTIPKIDYKVDVNNLVNYWRSNDSNRFITTQFTNKNSAGGEVGPVPGWHDWDVGQYAYPFTSTSTDAQFWINCTDKWGNVIDSSALAQGEGNDTASNTPPGAPTDFSATKSADGGVTASWKAPDETSPSGIAGYYLTVAAWAPGSPKVFGDNWSTPVNFTGTSGSIPAGYVSVVKASLTPGWTIDVAVGTVSREGSIGRPTLIPLDRLGG